MEVTEITIEEKLKLLFSLQTVDLKIRDIYELRGALPVEIQGLKDTLEGLKARISNLKGEVDRCKTDIAGFKSEIEHSNTLIDKYEEQRKNIKNNREYESLSKEIEYQRLEITLSDKRIKERTLEIATYNVQIDEAKKTLAEKKEALAIKQTELSEIMNSTNDLEKVLKIESNEIVQKIDFRLLTAYNRLKNTHKNSVAVASVLRNACSGCYNKIPLQRQLEINQSKKIIVCEYCGRLLVSDLIMGIMPEIEEKV